MANLFTSQTPVTPDANDGGPLTVATTFYATVDGDIDGCRFYAPSTVGAGTFAAALWSVDTDDDPADTGTGTLLGTATFGALTPSEWNTVDFSSPIAITANTAYRISVRTSEGRYAVTGGFWSVPLSNGDLRGVQDQDEPLVIGTLANGTYIESTSLYPNKTFNSGCYFVDVEFSVSGGDASANPDGIPVPVSLGAPTSAFVATSAVPTGIEVPVSLGAPSAFHYVTPDGIGASIALGEPTIEAPPGPAPESGGSWFALLAAVQSARADAELNRERERHPVECPYDGWPLTPTDRGLHCEFGGHVITPKA